MGDWVIQPETWEAPTDGAYLLEPGQQFYAPLTVTDYSVETQVGIQTGLERYREKDDSYTAAATRGDVHLTLTPLSPDDSWGSVYTESFLTVAIIRITRMMQAPNNFPFPLVSLFNPPDLREAATANDAYVWQQMVTWMNVSSSSWGEITRYQTTSLHRHVRVNARYLRRIGGVESMYLNVQYGVMYLDGYIGGSGTNLPVPTRHVCTVRNYLRSWIK